VPLALTIDRFTNGLTRPFFGWGEIFSLFPSTLTDTFGTRNATRNYGCLYMAQGIGAIFGGPMASLLHEPTGTWTSVFARRHHRRPADSGPRDRRTQTAAGSISSGGLAPAGAATPHHPAYAKMPDRLPAYSRACR
jgi:hypothetical protein